MPRAANAHMARKALPVALQRANAKVTVEKMVSLLVKTINLTIVPTHEDCRHRRFILVSHMHNAVRADDPDAPCARALIIAIASMNPSAGVFVDVLGHVTLSHRWHGKHHSAEGR